MILNHKWEQPSFIEHWLIYFWVRMPVDRAYQLNVGGNTDFQNMLERKRLTSKKYQKLDQSLLSLNFVNLILTREYSCRPERFRPLVD